MGRIAPSIIERSLCQCKSSFSVLSGTISEKMKLPLRKWFMAIGLMVNAKKSVSNHQLASDLDLNHKSAWFLQVRIRAEVASKQGQRLLRGIVEADETWIGAKPRRTGGNPRGRGTRTAPVIGAVERAGRAVAQPATDLTGRGVLRFVRETIDPADTLLITDEYRSYRAVRRTVQHAVINHGRAYADGGASCSPTRSGGSGRS